MGKRMRAREERKEGQHGLAVVVVYLGHGELEETHGRPGFHGEGSALQAVHERGWCEGEKRWRGVEKWGARRGLL